MSEKKRRDITLGEMQDECKTRRDCRPCPYVDVCFCSIVSAFKSPATIDLTDPPRFTETQMALLRWWNDRGAVKAVITHHYEYGAFVIFEDTNGRQIGNIQETSVIAAVKDNGETLDLAELFGKEGEK